MKSDLIFYDRHMNVIVPIILPEPPAKPLTKMKLLPFLEKE